VRTTLALRPGTWFTLTQLQVVRIVNAWYDVRTA